MITPGLDPTQPARFRRTARLGRPCGWPACRRSRAAATPARWRPPALAGAREPRRAAEPLGLLAGCRPSGGTPRASHSLPRSGGRGARRTVVGDALAGRARVGHAVPGPAVTGPDGEAELPVQPGPETVPQRAAGVLVGAQ